MKTLNEYKKDNTELRKIISGLENDRMKYYALRNWVTGHFNWYVDISAKNENPNIPWLIKNIKDILVSTKI